MFAKLVRVLSSRKSDDSFSSLSTAKNCSDERIIISSRDIFPVKQLKLSEDVPAIEAGEVFEYEKTSSVRILDETSGLKHLVQMYKLADGRGWVNDFYPPNPSYRTIVALTAFEPTAAARRGSLGRASSFKGANVSLTSVDSFEIVCLCYSLLKK